jgi:hypothetical protein
MEDWGADFDRRLMAKNANSACHGSRSRRVHYKLWGTTHVAYVERLYDHPPSKNNCLPKLLIQRDFLLPGTHLADIALKTFV